jgi:hypothetical protein
MVMAVTAEPMFALLIHRLSQGRVGNMNQIKHIVGLLRDTVIYIIDTKFP